MKQFLLAVILFSLSCSNSNKAILPTSEAARRAAESSSPPPIKATIPLPKKQGS